MAKKRKHKGGLRDEVPALRTIGQALLALKQPGGESGSVNVGEVTGGGNIAAYLWLVNEVAGGELSAAMLDRLIDKVCQANWRLSFVAALNLTFAQFRQLLEPLIRPERIPPEERTIPITYRRAARLMGKGNTQDAAEWLAKCVADGTFACEHINRQSHVFRVSDFPKAAHKQLTPKST